MKAGRELDALIAEKVMGWKRGSFFGIDDDDRWWLYLGNGKWQQQGFGGKGFCPSTRIADAWLVVEKLGKNFDVSRCRVYQEIEAWFWEASFHNGPDAEADTAPLAICLAALKAVAHE